MRCLWNMKLKWISCNLFSFCRFAVRLSLAAALDACPAATSAWQVGDLMLTNLCLARLPRARHFLHRTRLRTDLPSLSILIHTNNLLANLTIFQASDASPTPRAHTRLLKSDASPFGFRTSSPLNGVTFLPRLGISVPFAARRRSPSCFGNMVDLLGQSSGHTCNAAPESRMMDPTLPLALHVDDEYSFLHLGLHPLPNRLVLHIRPIHVQYHPIPVLGHLRCRGQWLPDSRNVELNRRRSSQRLPKVDRAGLDGMGVLATDFPSPTLGLDSARRPTIPPLGPLSACTQSYVRGDCSLAQGKALRRTPTSEPSGRPPPAVGPKPSLSMRLSSTHSPCSTDSPLNLSSGCVWDGPTLADGSGLGRMSDSAVSHEPRSRSRLALCAPSPRPRGGKRRARPCGSRAWRTVCGASGPPGSARSTAGFLRSCVEDELALAPLVTVGLMSFARHSQPAQDPPDRPPAPLGAA